MTASYTCWSCLSDGLYLALLSFSWQLGRVADPWDISDPVYPVSVASIKKLINWVSQFRVTGPQLNFTTGCHSCQSSIYYTKQFPRGDIKFQEISGISSICRSCRHPALTRVQSRWTCRREHNVIRGLSSRHLRLCRWPLSPTTHCCRFMPVIFLAINHQRYQLTAWNVSCIQPQLHSSASKCDLMFLWFTGTYCL